MATRLDLDAKGFTKGHDSLARHLEDGRANSSSPAYHWGKRRRAPCGISRLNPRVLAGAHAFARASHACDGRLSEQDGPHRVGALEQGRGLQGSGRAARMLREVRVEMCPVWRGRCPNCRFGSDGAWIVEHPSTHNHNIGCRTAFDGDACPTIRAEAVTHVVATVGHGVIPFDLAHDGNGVGGKGNVYSRIPSRKILATTAPTGARGNGLSGDVDFDCLTKATTRNGHFYSPVRE